MTKCNNKSNLDGFNSKNPVITNPKNNFIKRHNALGSSSFVGGLTWVGEYGPEVVNLPRGSQVLSKNKSESLTGMSFTNNFHITIQGNADDKVVKNAVTDSMKEFERKFNIMMNNRKRLGYSPI